MDINDNNISTLWSNASKRANASRREGKTGAEALWASVVSQCDAADALLHRARSMAAAARRVAASDDNDPGTVEERAEEAAELEFAALAALKVAQATFDAAEAALGGK